MFGDCYTCLYYSKVGINFWYIENVKKFLPSFSNKLKSCVMQSWPWQWFICNDILIVLHGGFIFVKKSNVCLGTFHVAHQMFFQAIDKKDHIRWPELRKGHKWGRNRCPCPKKSLTKWSSHGSHSHSGTGHNCERCCMPFDKTTRQKCCPGDQSSPLRCDSSPTGMPETLCKIERK